MNYKQQDTWEEIYTIYEVKILVHSVVFWDVYFQLKSYKSKNFKTFSFRTMNNNSTNPNSSEEASNPSAAPKTTNDQDFIKFGSKIKIKKTVFFTILTITAGFIIIIIGLCKALKLFQDDDKTIKNNNINNNNIPIYNNARIRSRNYRIDKDVTMGITIAVGGFFLILIIFTNFE